MAELKFASAQEEFERLEALGKTRRLTDLESLLLERAMYHKDGLEQPAGLNRALARHGVKRDMRPFRKD